MAFGPFSSVPVPPKGSTNFDESHGLSGTFPLSKVIPVFTTDTIPGDRWKVDVFNLTKLETLIAPAMQQINASVLWFKIPKRLVFKKFKNWYSGGADGDDKSEKPHIFLRHFLYEMTDYIQGGGDQNEFLYEFFGPGSLWQYLGLPVPITYKSSPGTWQVETIDNILEAETPPATGYVEPEKPDSDFIDIMPFMAYWMLYDQYFMDQSLCEPMFTDSESGEFKINRNKTWSYTAANGTVFEFPAATGSDLAEGGEISFADFMPLLCMFNRAWQKEYFTSALPTPQRGPEVKIGLVDGTAPVEISSQDAVLGAPGTGDDPILGRFDSPIADADGQPVNADAAQSNYATFSSSGGQTLEALKGTLSKLNGIADLTGLSPISIVAFRNLFKLQAFLEKNNIGGGRFIETILAQWAVRVPDFTVQRAQYVRATSIPVQISEVVATANSSTGVNRTLGDQGGLARTQGNLGYVRLYTHEPSFIFGLYCVTCPPAYAGQGIPRMFQRITRFDEPWPDFQHIGEQAIKLREIYYPFKHDEMDRSDEDFGYQQRFSEYKYMPNRIVGDFATSLSYWHMARMFDTPPVLNADFVTQHLDERIFAVQNTRTVIADFWFKAVARRKLSKFSTPKLT